MMKISQAVQDRLAKLTVKPKPCSVCGGKSTRALASVYHDKATVNFLCEEHMPELTTKARSGDEAT